MTMSSSGGCPSGGSIGRTIAVAPRAGQGRWGNPGHGHGSVLRARPSLLA